MLKILYTLFGSPLDFEALGEPIGKSGSISKPVMEKDTYQHSITKIIR